MGIKTRFAPSPTGYLHLGNVWVAFLNWLWTRQNKGRIILRIEESIKAGAGQTISQQLKKIYLGWG